MGMSKHVSGSSRMTTNMSISNHYEEEQVISKKRKLNILVTSKNRYAYKGVGNLKQKPPSILQATPNAKSRLHEPTLTSIYWSCSLS